MFHAARTLSRRRSVAILAAASLAAVAPALSSAWAQPPAFEAGGARASLAARFAAANTTHDGRLTREQAEAGGMKMVARYFDAIDVSHRGYVTLPEIRAFAQAHRRGRPGAPPAPPQD